MHIVHSAGTVRRTGYRRIDQRCNCALAGWAVGSRLTLPRRRASQASSSSSSIVTGVGGSSSEDADVVDEPLLERDVAGLLELDDASGAKTLPMAGWLCARSAVD